MKRKSIYSIAMFLVIFVQASFAQTPLDTATLGLTLQCSGGYDHRSGIAYNPNQELYYSVHAGANTYPIETFDASGTPVQSNSAGFDYRGVWWNTNTDTLEGNGFNNLGIWAQDLDANYYALGTGTNLIPSVSGPDIQSSANYDPILNYIIYYHSDSIYRYSRANHTLISTTAITGLPVPTSNLNRNTIVYTGVSGMEYGVYDYVNRAFYFINKTTNAYAFTTQLPASAPNPNRFKFGYDNGYVWLYDHNVSQWKGYKAVLPCTPSTGTDTQTACSSYTWIDGNTYTASNSTATDTISGGAASGCDSIVTLNLTINHSNTGTDAQTACNSYTWIDGNTYTASNNTATHTLTNTAGCDSVVTLNLTITTPVTYTISIAEPTLSVNPTADAYQWLDCENNNSVIAGATAQNYTATANGSYAVVVTNGACIDTLACSSITSIGIETTNFGILSIYPNPTKDKLNVKFEDNATEASTVSITNVLGQQIFVRQNISDKTLEINTAEFTDGVYYISIMSESRKVTQSFVIEK